jgi:hypothetical protein
MSLPIDRQASIGEIAAWSNRTTASLIEGYADLLFSAPNDVAGNARAVLEGQVETIGNVTRIGNIERRPRNHDVADQTVDPATGELDRSGH